MQEASDAASHAGRLLEELTRGTVDFEKLGEDIAGDVALQYQCRVAMALPSVTACHV
jgi:hypothetical protein